MFEPFVQADSTRSRKHAGLGLGLSIARRLVELHHGDIRVESNGRGQGAVFTITLPAKSVSAPLLAKEPLWILQISDDPNVRSVKLATEFGLNSAAAFPVNRSR